VLNVESAIKAQNLKASQHQPARQTPAVDSGHSTFESMLDDNAANASAAAKDKDKTQNAATDRTQKGPEPKDKSDKPATDSKPTGDQPAPKTTAAPDKTQETVPSETPVVVVKKTDDPDTDADVSTDATADTTTSDIDSTSAPTDKPATPDATNAVPVIPVHVLTPADAQTTAPEDTDEAATEAPAIVTAAKQKPAGTASLTGHAVETDDSGKPVAADKDQSVTADQQNTDGTQQAAQPGQQAPADKDKASQVALTDAEKEHIARARGEGTDKADPTAVHGKGEQADAGRAVQKTTVDVPTPHVQAPTAHTANTTAATAPAAPQTPAPAAVPIPLSAVGVEIASKATSGKKEFEIRLDPPELGRIEVRLNVDRDGNVTSRLIADRQDTLDLLKRDSSGLERALQDAGLKTSDNGMQFSLRDQSFAQQQHDGNSRSGTAHVVVPDEALPAVDMPAQSYGRLIGRSGGLDIRV
jgi:flagellar hook-length control protein FliK